MKSEQQQILDSFLNAFSQKRKSSFVLYGLGGNTEFLLRHTDGYHIIGLMDAQNEGKEYFGFPVLTIDEVRAKADVIVIVARTSVLNVIYNRIKHLEPDVEIYNTSGDRLCDLFKETSTDYINDPYWEKSLDGLCEEIEKYSIVSFDIFDTLMMRKALLPEDVFCLTAERIKKKGYDSTKYSYYRKEAEKLAKKDVDTPTIDDIYECYSAISGMNSEDTEVFKAVELETEDEILVVRSDMLTAFDYAKKHCKTVLLVSDMYFSAGVLGKILEKKGISGWHDIFISCDYSASKEKGTLYERVRGKYGNNILHIGDNYRADVEMAQKNGFDVYCIRSGYEMLLNSPLQYLLISATDMADHIWVGEFVAEMLNSPFSLSKGRGKLSLYTNKDMAKWCFLPMIYSFFSWIMPQIKGKSRDNNIILFTARDGYLPMKIYEGLIRDCSEYYPRPIYFYTSRRSITVANMKTDSDIAEKVDRLHSTGRLKNILHNMFGVESNNGDSEGEEIVSLPADKRKCLGYILKCKERILSEAERERRAYKKYIEELNILDDTNIYIYDLACTGTVPKGIEELIGRKCTLICFASFNIPNRFYDDMSDILSFLGNIMEYSAKYSFGRYYKLFEIISAPNEGSLQYIKDSGERILSDEKLREEIYAEIHKMQKEIANEINSSREKAACSKRVADDFLNILSPNYSIVDSDIERLFWYDDPSVDEKLHCIWSDVVG